MSDQKYYNFPFEEYSSITQLPGEEQNLAEVAVKVAKNAYSPYSGFSVGAAILLENGKVITGNNQENAAYPSGLCAERVALFYASAQYPDVPVKTLVVTAIKNNIPIEAPVPPCGSCRQVFIEWEKRFNKPFSVVMVGTEKIIKVEKASFLLPFNFQADFL